MQGYGQQPYGTSPYGTGTGTVVGVDSLYARLRNDPELRAEFLHAMPELAASFLTTLAEPELLADDLDTQPELNFRNFRVERLEA